MGYKRGRQARSPVSGLGRMTDGRTDGKADAGVKGGQPCADSPVASSQVLGDPDMTVRSQGYRSGLANASGGRDTCQSIAFHDRPMSV
jgi:hypothetical protein